MIIQIIEHKNSVQLEGNHCLVSSGIAPIQYVSRSRSTSALHIFVEMTSLKYCSVCNEIVCSILPLFFENEMLTLLWHILYVMLHDVNIM